ncbi:MAG: hypothetical protein JKY32_07895 [Rhizobiales bacterium]|nr:hypothetical protein [Hyphomicrobiales bacterium]
MSGKRGDPQKFFAFLAKLQNANLDKGLANYNKYLETPWYRLGLSQGYYLATDYTPWGSTWNYNNVLDRFTAEMNDVGAFNAALLSASRLDVTKLKKRHKKAYALLVERGFIAKGKYTLPKAFTHDAGTGLDEASKLTELDRTINVGSAAEALVTIIIPGKLSFAGTEYIASRWIALNGLGRLGVEAALFTGYSRAGAMMLDPSLGLNQEYWTFDAVLKDYAHNLLIMGGLQGSSAIAGQFGKALRGGEALRYGAKDIMNMPFSQLSELGAREWNWFLFGGAGRVGLEAATLQAIDSATSGAPPTAEGVLRISIFLAELRAIGMPFNKAISGLRTDLIPGGKLGKNTSDLRVFDRIETKQNLQLLLQDHSGDWHKLVDAFKAGKVSKRTMRILTRARNGIVDGLANQVVLEIYGPDRISRQKMWDAVGSVNLTSDYDLSFKGEKSELAVLLFNQRFRSRWGRAMGIGGVESAGRLDTNVYTYPRYAEYGGNETDVLAQEIAAQLGVRRYSRDAAWQAHRQRLLDGLKEAERTQLQDVMDRVDRAYAEATRALDRLTVGVDANAQNFAANQLYGKALKRIMDLRALHEEASGAEQAKLAQQIRNTQSKALFFASEAYLTEAAINHVVFNTQAVGRKVTADSLLSGKQVTLELPMSGNMARQSLLEQLGYLQAQFNHYNAYNSNQKQAVKLSGKLSKYFLRLLDAAHIAGVDLQPIKELVRQTVDVEANRGNAEKLAEMLPGEQAAKYDNAVKKTMEWLSAEIYRKAPVSIVEPAKMLPARAKASKPRTVSQRLVGGKTNTAKSKPAPSARGAGYAPTGGGAPTNQAGQPTQVPTPSQTGQTPAPTTAQPQNVVDADGTQTGWISRDPNGQAWYQPLGFPGATPPPPLKVQLLQGGQVVSQFRKLGRAAPPAKTAALKPTTKVVPPLKPALQPRTAPGAKSPPRPGRPIIDKSGNEVGWVETDPNGQAWLVPDAPQGTLASPPQKVNVDPDGTVSLGPNRLGKLGPKTASLPATRKQKNATGKDQSRAVRDRDGNVIGHLQTDPNGQTWLTPNAPPGVLTTPPQKVEVLGNGAILIAGRVIGQQDQGDQPRQSVKVATATASGKSVTLTVKILPEIFGPKRPKPKIGVALPGAPVGAESASIATPSPIANDKPDDGAARGFEGLWLGWHNTIIRHVREGDTVRVILVYGPPEMTASGWVIGEDTGKGTVSGRTMTGKNFLPRQMYPQCPGRLAMPFKATLDASGNRFTTSTRIMRQPDPAVCRFVPGEEWTNGLWLTRITEAEAAEIIKTSKASVDQAQAPDVSTTKVPEFNTGIPENTGAPTLPTQTYDIPSARALLNTDNTLCAGVIEGLGIKIQGYDDNLRDYDQSEPTGNPNLDELRFEILDSAKQGISVMAHQVEQCLKISGGLPKD